MPAFYIEGDEPKLADPSGRSLHKINNLLKIIEAKTGSTTITGPVTVSNEVEVTNSTGNPIPVSGTVGLDSTSLAALENISVTFPATQNVNVTNAGLSVSVSNLPATQPVSLASAPVTPVTDNGGSLTVDGTVTVNDMTSGNAKTKIVDSVGADVSYITAGTAGTPSASVLSVQGISGGTSLPISGTVDTGLTQPLTDTQLRAAVVPVSLASVPSHAVTQATAANLNATVVGSGSFTAAQATASSLKAQAQILDSAGSLLTYAATGTAGTPGVDVVSIQGVSSGVAVTVSGPVTDTQLRASAISVSDRGSVGQATVTTFTSTSSLVLMASNSARKLLTVFNEGAGLLYLLYGAGTASITNYSVRINSGDYLEIEKYTGAVTGIFGTAGTARATEIS